MSGDQFPQARGGVDEQRDERPTSENRSSGRRGRGRRQRSRLIVTVLTIAAGVAGSLAGAHPTGTPIVDPLYGALFAGIITLACSRSSRGPCIVLAAAAVVMSRGWLLVPAAAAFVLSFSTVFARRRRQRTGALIGAVAAPVILRWPHLGFTGLTALIAAAAVAPCLVSAYRKLPRRQRRRTRRTVLGVAVLAIILSVPALVGALLARGPLERAISAAQGALGAASNGNGGSGVTRLRAADAELATAQSRTGGWWSAGSRLVPVVAQQRQAITRTTATTRNLTTTAQQAASAIDLRGLGYHNGHIDLTRIEALGPPLHTLSDRLTATTRVLNEVRSPWLATPIRSRLNTLGAEVTKARSSADLAKQAVAAAPGLLGQSGPRHYFVAFMTPSESRGLDGFIGSFGVLTVDHGTLNLTQAAPIAQLVAPLQAHPAQLTGLTDYLARYGRFQPGKFPQDLTYSPDFPTVAKAISEVYPQAGGSTVDGVLALDPYALAGLLQFTGPISVPGLGQPLTSANAAPVLLRDQYQTFAGPASANVLRHDFLQDALRGAFAKLTSASLPGFRQLSTGLDPLALQGRLLFWSNHPSEQPLLERLHLDGRFPAAGKQDLLAVTTQNAGNSKMDAFLYRQITDRVSVDPATGGVSSQVSISLHNDAPTHGPAVFTTNPAMPGLAPGTNYTWLSVYSPMAFDKATVDGRPASLSAGRELGVNAYSVYVTIPSGTTVTIALSLSGKVAAGKYGLSLRQQPLVNPDQVNVQVAPATGWTVTGDSGSGIWTPGPAERQQHTFSFMPS